MNRNEAIAEKMGWLANGKIYLGGGPGPLKTIMPVNDFNPEHNIVHAKLLQARMVEDGWTLCINHGAVNNWFDKVHFSASAHKTIELSEHEHAIGEHFDIYGKDTEQSVLVELFAKVYGIA